MFSGSGDDSLDGLAKRVSRVCPLTPSLSPGNGPRASRDGAAAAEDQQEDDLHRRPAAVTTSPDDVQGGVRHRSLCGGSASGKTTVANKIIEALDVPWVVLLSMDSFYTGVEQRGAGAGGKERYNFDHPDAFDFELLVTVLRKLKKGKSIKVPVYDFTSHSRRKEWKTFTAPTSSSSRGSWPSPTRSCSSSWT
ncbi:hypothetical protein INR49_004135 [Caranx melampygus]|nr:hypothetical protein INR49_004135 [Caranx melampygus]